MIGNFEDVLEHAKSIKDTIESVIYWKMLYKLLRMLKIISTLKKHYEDTRYKIELAFKYNIIDRYI